MEWMLMWTRPYGVQYSETLITALGKKGPAAACVSENHILYPENRNQAYYVSRPDWEKIRGVLKELVSTPEYRGSEISKFHSTAGEYINSAKRASAACAESSNPELLSLYEDFRNKWATYSSYLWTMFITNEEFSKKMDGFLKGKPEGLVRYASTPSEKASALRLNDELKALKENFSEEGLRKVYEEYRWIPCVDVHCSPWTLEDVGEYLSNYSPAEEPAPDGSTLEGLDGEERRLVELSRNLIHIKDLRDEYRRIGMLHAQSMFSEIGKRMGLSLKELSYATGREIRNSLTSGAKPDLSLLRGRMDAYMVFEDGDETACASGDEIERCAAALGFQKKECTSQEIVGKCASRGKASGRVRIVLRDDDLKKVEKEDILVALTTGPSYVPAMARASAFVTDQGGFTCHAGIVAREMKKPCIVGTGNATLVLKDGDFIEVDADKGTVKVAEPEK